MGTKDGMIPSTAIHFNDDDTLWWVTDLGTFTDWEDDYLERECDTCDGDGYVKPDKSHLCPDCDGTGRHTFTIEVENEEWHCETCNDSGISHTGDTASSCGYCPTDHTYSVSVVPGMVLRVVASDEPCDPAELRNVIVSMDNGSANYITERNSIATTTLPPDARPGMWAVQLQVHQSGENQ